TTSRFRSLISGRRILQRYTLLSTPLFQLPFGFDELKQPCCRKLRNPIVYQGVFRFDYAGSGANYRRTESGVKG
ncbi:hypothetical protein, partial [Pseudomonas cyclaminis]|uniref:hypothetical protein n=1 Tax=Pseudomonas cyclaminis TaxID=2781239 RepID=UPI0019D5DEDD